MGHFTWDERVEDTFWAGPTATFQEPTFIPKRGSEVEGEGYLIALQNHLDVLRNDIVILDALDVAKGPVAVIHLPFKLKLGLHGNWVDAREIREWRERRSEGGSVGPARAAERPLPWQVRFGGAEWGCGWGRERVVGVEVELDVGSENRSGVK